MITHIVFDIDDTLMDYYTAEMQVTRALFRENGLKADQAALDRCWQMSWHYWDAENLSRTDLEEVQREYHERYHRGVLAHCAEIASEYGFSMTAEETYDRFNELFSQQVTLYDDALTVLDALRAKGYVLCAATNGLSRIQEKRTAALDGRVSHLFCSEALGVVKPTQAFFEQMLRESGADPRSCMMVGDSLTSDIAGAASVGMMTVWINRSGKKNTGSVLPDYEIHSLDELLRIVEKIQEGEV